MGKISFMISGVDLATSVPLSGWCAHYSRRGYSVWYIVIFLPLLVQVVNIFLSNMISRIIRFCSKFEHFLEFLLVILIFFNVAQCYNIRKYPLLRQRNIQFKILDSFQEFVSGLFSSQNSHFYSKFYASF